jgi:hypothetical protein
MNIVKNYLSCSVVTLGVVGFWVAVFLFIASLLGCADKRFEPEKVKTVTKGIPLTTEERERIWFHPALGDGLDYQFGEPGKVDVNVTVGGGLAVPAYYQWCYGTPMDIFPGKR